MSKRLAQAALTEELGNKLESYMKETDRSKSQVVRMSLNNFLEAERNEPAIALALVELVTQINKLDRDYADVVPEEYRKELNTKVLVYRTENQNKGNQTPYHYLVHTNREWTFDEYKSMVIALSKKKEYAISRKKVQNLLFSEDIKKIEVLKGFINRNINDTRYASRVVLNTIQSYFKAKGTDTKVHIIRGGYTHQMRVNMKLDKNRDAGCSHHAVDAMLIAYSRLGYEGYRKLQGTFIDFETGEILNEQMWTENMSDDIYVDYLYGTKWLHIRNEITRAEKEIKYWWYVDKKSNRRLCNQTIRGTRDYDGKTYKINSLDIRTKEGVEIFKKLALSNAEKDKARLLVYKNDRRTFDELVYILRDYSDSKNPFVQYEKETGDCVRKYAKKHNGPRIDKLKYTDGEVGACIDISHKYGHEKGSKKVILESLVPYRMDVYFNEEQDAYYLVGVKQSDVKYEKGKYTLDENAYAATLVNEKMIKHGQTRMDLESLGFEFRLSFYENDIIEYEKDGQIFVERFKSRTKPNVRNYVETKPVDKAKFEGQNQVGLWEAATDWLEREVFEYKGIMELLKDMVGEIDESMEEKCRLYFFGNQTRAYGAVAILRTDILEKFAEEIGGNFYIIPSSIHELLLLPDRGMDDNDDASLREMIEMVNNHEVSNEERLSYNLYYYDKESKKVEIK